ncbi:MAG TPA: DNA-directed RNA polymerase subunit beta' [Thermomicrobiales bacterium]|nr:DNA-directed RNA polymerase subunit beta' [Thermomicrobiales bacterium]
MATTKFPDISQDRMGGDAAAARTDGARGGFPRGGSRDRSSVLDVNNFDAIRIRLASPEAIRSWSHGEVVKPETINYRTLKPEHGGLFCERIFGPTKDWECYCGKYKRIRFAGTVCDKCGVEVTRSKVRRERMGHIELAAPVAHIWYVKGTPSRLGLLLDLPPRTLERVLYFASYMVTDVDDAKRQQAIDEINELHEETIAELRAEAQSKVDEILESSGADVSSIEDNAAQMQQRVTIERDAALAELEQEYNDTKAQIEDAMGAAAEKRWTFRRKVVIKKGEAINADRLQKLDDVYGRLRDDIISEAEHHLSGGDMLAGAERDQLSHDATEQVKKIEQELEEQVKAETADRDETIKQLTDLHERQVLTENDFRTLQEVVPPGVFEAGMGAEAVYSYVSRKIDLDQLAVELRNEMQSASDVRRKKATKRLRVIEALRKSGNKPHWMIFTALPVIPPELRPMVQLDGGRFATSDLNDLYRRVINRNNRLKRLLELGAPEIIVRNEKRMLQEAVDALIDNGRRGRAVSGSSKHKLKSLSDMLKGKQGRFRQNLLGKRVDYSGRSVIVVGPDLALDECGLPKRMALELFKPFVMRRLVERDLAHNIKAAKRFVERVHPDVWDVLEDVIQDYLVLLNRAPTLHRLGIQAFRPKLIEGSAIQLHPMVTTAFNADFDGDQMAVHVPLSDAAQQEARTRMLSVNNLLAPANGEPIVAPTQDIVLGIYYMTSLRDHAMDMERGTVPRGYGKSFSSLEEVKLAYDSGILDVQAEITVRTDRDGGEMKRIQTTVGRALLNLELPEELGKFYNETMGRKQLRGVIADCYRTFENPAETARIANDLKRLGFALATRGGVSIALADVTESETKQELVDEAQKAADAVDRQYRRGLVTEAERLRELEVIWNNARDTLTEDVEARLKGQNSIYMMADSGAKGNMNQISQMAGMRGLVLDPGGKIIDIPIKSNFREGLTVLEYFLSTHGARKGLADTALRTADSGYLTRRLVDVAQDVIVTMEDCGTDKGIVAPRIEADGRELTADEYRARIAGRIAAADVVHPETGEIIARPGDEISERAVDEDGNVRDLVQAVIDSGVEKINFRSVMACQAPHGVCQLCYGRNLATGKLVEKGEAVGIIAAQSIGEPGTQLTMRTFHTGGVARADITTGLPRVEELFEAREPKGAALLAPRAGRVSIEDEDEERVLRIRSVEEHSWHEELGDGYEVIIQEGSQVQRGKTVIAHGPNGEELFAGVDGTFFLDGRTVYIRSESEEVDEFHINYDDQILIEDGQEVTPGTQLTFGPKNPHALLATLGPGATQRYIIDEVQKVYRSQGVATNDKHIEVIARQMLRKVQVAFPGDTDLLEGDTVDRYSFSLQNEGALVQGGEPATAAPLLLGITKASLETDSFLSAASFQETTRVLTEAAINGKVDHLRGLKENVIIGKLIPAGSGFEHDQREPEPEALQEATVAAMRGEAAIDTEASYEELMQPEGGPVTAVMDREPDSEDGQRAPEDAAEINDADVEDETVQPQEQE